MIVKTTLLPFIMSDTNTLGLESLTISQNLCATCLSIDPEFFSSKYEGHLNYFDGQQLMHSSYSELENSARNGCPLCRILIGTQEDSLLDWGEEVRDTQAIYLRRCEEFSERMVAACHGYEEKNYVYFSCIPDFWGTLGILA